jgi:PqqD family protein of HPr-rel-A system
LTVWYARREGVLVEAMGHLWVAFSPATGETTLLNDESASILEILEEGAASAHSICADLAEDSGLGLETVTNVVEPCWPRLIEAGLVRAQRADHANSR